MLRPNGQIIDTPGYDPASGLIYDPQGVTFPPIPLHPTKGEFDKALAQVKRHFRGYVEKGSVEPKYAAVMYSALLTGLYRSSLPAVPVHIFSATDFGTGKSFAAQTVSASILGHRVPAMSPGPDTTETEKRLGSMMLSGAPVVVVDNVEDPITGKFWCSAVTEAISTVRILCSSKNVSIPNTTFFMVTGLNVKVARDMCRRSVLCKIDPGVENPELRKFDFDPVQEALAERPETVVAGLTMLRYAQEHLGELPPVQPLGNFEAWGIVRQVLLYADLPDPVITQEDIKNDDQTREALTQFLQAWYDQFGESRKKAIDLILANIWPEDLPRNDFDGNSQARSLAAYIRRYRGTVRGGLRIEQTDVPVCGSFSYWVRKLPGDRGYIGLAT